MASNVEDSGISAQTAVAQSDSANSPSLVPTPISAGNPGKTQTPSPNTPGSHHAGSSSKRPPRKSTLTQQQKNQKRQRATQDQLSTLEMEFNKNPTPTANVRERIAEEINMTERSVQIWFQNRYGACPASRCWQLATTRLIGYLGAPRSRHWRRRAWKRARTSTRYRSPCALIWPCRPWSPERDSEQDSSDGASCPTATVVCSSAESRVDRAKFVSSSPTDLSRVRRHV